MKGFVSKRLTLSEEALKMAKEFKKVGAFRSLSHTIEELIRMLNMIKEQGGFKIKNDLSNLEEIELILLEEYEKRMKNLDAN